MNAPPKPNDSKPVWEMVIEDMHARDQFGRAKYHTPLQMSNDRDHALDAYEEVLDLAVYMKQVIIERAELRSEVERLRAENEGMRKALDGVPDPAAFMAAVDEMLKTDSLTIESYRQVFWQRLKNLRSARRKH